MHLAKSATKPCETNSIKRCAEPNLSEASDQATITDLGFPVPCTLELTSQRHVIFACQISNVSYTTACEAPNS